MSFTFGFYNSLNKDRVYDSLSISKIFDGLITDGVYATIGDRFKVRLSTNDNEIIVGSGRAWFDHTWNLNDSDMVLTGLDSHATLDRWDVIIMDINSDTAYRSNSIQWIYGTADVNPSKPELINTPGHYQYPLAYIYRRANSIITDSDITNTVGTDECPYCGGLLTDTKNIAPVDSNSTASKQYNAGEYIIHDDGLYKITKDISEGSTFIEYPISNYNIKKTTIAEEFYEILTLSDVAHYDYDSVQNILYISWASNS